jgi:leader peptidase (prepilin peptidase) / N-methyltransferase
MAPAVSELPRWLVLGVAIALGLVFGSFLNVVIYRLPRGENLAFPGSRCPACGQSIAAYDNVPVMSWLLLGGRARCCRAKISARYPLVELIGGLLAWGLVKVVVWQLPPDTAWYWALGAFLLDIGLGLALVAVAFIDLDSMLIPDEITLGGTVLGLVTAPWRTELWRSSLGAKAAELVGLGAESAFGAVADSLLGAVVGFAVIWLPFDLLYGALRGQPGMGRGDAKLTMLAGAWFGWVGAVFALLAGSIQGTLVALGIYAAKGRIDEPEAVVKERAELRAAIENATDEERRILEEEMEKDPVAHEPEPGLAKARISFGPFLALGALEYLLFGPALAAAYLDWLWP